MTVPLIVNLIVTFQTLELLSNVTLSPPSSFISAAKKSCVVKTSENSYASKCQTSSMSEIFSYTSETSAIVGHCSALQSSEMTPLMFTVGREKASFDLGCTYIDTIPLESTSCSPLKVLLSEGSHEPTISKSSSESYAAIFSLRICSMFRSISI